MSTVWWAGVAIDPDTQGTEMAASLDLHLDLLLSDADGGEHFATIDERDGSQTKRYRFGMLVITEIVDRLGQRIGCGIEACDEKDATLQLDRIRQFLQAWGIEALASVWQWNRMTAPAAPPQLIETSASGT
jgi:hypothetical protein